LAPARALKASAAAPMNIPIFFVLCMVVSCLAAA